LGRQDKFLHQHAAPRTDATLSAAIGTDKDMTARRE